MSPSTPLLWSSQATPMRDLHPIFACQMGQATASMLQNAAPPSSSYALEFPPLWWKSLVTPAQHQLTQFSFPPPYLMPSHRPPPPVLLPPPRAFYSGINYSRSEQDFKRTNECKQYLDTNVPQRTNQVNNAPIAPNLTRSASGEIFMFLDLPCLPQRFLLPWAYIQRTNKEMGLSPGEVPNVVFRPPAPKTDTRSHQNYSQQSYYSVPSCSADQSGYSTERNMSQLSNYSTETINYSRIRNFSQQSNYSSKTDYASQESSSMPNTNPNEYPGLAYYVNPANFPNPLNYSNPSELPVTHSSSDTTGSNTVTYTVACTDPSTTTTMSCLCTQTFTSSSNSNDGPNPGDTSSS